MTAFELYEAAFDSAQDEFSTDTTEYIRQYSEGALDHCITDEQASQILACHIKFKEDGNGTNDFFHMVKKPLSEIEI